MNWRLVNVALATVLTAWSVDADLAGDRLRNCCIYRQICFLEDLCVYPPPVYVDIIEKVCLMWSFGDFVHCFTGGTDQRDCCRRADVTMGGQHPQCLDLCYDSRPFPGPWYVYCNDRMEQIAKCNHDANNH